MSREDYIASLTKANAKRLSPSVFDYITRWERKTGLSIDSPLTRDQYIDLLGCMRISIVSSFNSRKAIVVGYLEHLVSEGQFPAEHVSILKDITYEDIPIDIYGVKAHYKNFADLNECIEECINLSDGIDDERHDVAIAALYLAWVGFTEEQAVNCLKSDVQDGGVLLNGKFIAVPKMIELHLKRLRYSIGFLAPGARGGIRRWRYVDSPYLLRSPFRGQIAINGLKSTIHRFTSVREKEFVLEYQCVRKSGMFFRAVLKEMEIGDIDLNDPNALSDLMGIPINQMSQPSIIREYQKYKNYVKK